MKKWFLINFIFLTLIFLFLISGCSHQQISEKKDEKIIQQYPQQQYPQQQQIQQQTQQHEQGQQTTKTSAKKNLAQRLREIGVPCIPSTLNEYTTGKSLVIDPKNTNTIYVAVRYKGIFKTTDAGANWKKITNGIFMYPAQNDLSKKCYQADGKIVIDPKNPQTLFISLLDVNSGPITDPYSETVGVYKTVDGGMTWNQTLENWMNAGGAGALALDPTSPEIIYYGIDNTPASYKESEEGKLFNTIGVIYKSSNGGEKWQELPTGLHFGLHGTAIFVNPKNSNQLVLLTNTHEHIHIESEGKTIDVPGKQHLSVLKSDNQGKTWYKGGRLPQGFEMIVDGDVSPQKFSNIFAIPFVFPEEGKQFEQKSFFSTDGGMTFKESSSYMQVVKYNPHDPDGKHLVGYTLYGPPKILESKDSGNSWQELGNLPQEAISEKISITNFEWDPNDQNVLYISGGAGYVWRSRDAGKTWEMILNLKKLQDIGY